jgi:hypothetical protein
LAVPDKINQSWSMWRSIWKLLLRNLKIIIGK